jgi:hypothetical protein
MKFSVGGALAFGFAVIGTPAPARAEALDPALERLVLDPPCHNGGSNPDPAIPFGAFTPQSFPGGNPAPCEPDDAAFTKLISQYAFAIAPSAMRSARTTGYGGFHLAIEANYTSINGGKSYWRQGTQGARDPNTNQAALENTDAPGVLQLYSLKFRKGFGFGVELTGVVGFMPQTSLISGGVDVRMSLLEGFRTGPAGILPDVAVGAAVRTITGTPQFQLTVMGLDTQVSKPLPIADSSVLTPWLGYQYLFIYGDSGLIDMTPATDAIQACNYAGPAAPGNPKTTASGETVYDGSPVCNGGQPYDFNNNVVFSPVRLRRHRLLAGVNYRYEMLAVGGQLIMDLVPPGDAQPDADNQRILSQEDKQFSLVFELGAMF